MSAPPYMKFFWGDYFKSTRHLTRDQHGAYLMLIGEAWRLGGTLPDDDQKLAAWAICTPAEWAEIKPIIMEFFALRRGKWVHDRVREELASYQTTSRKRKEAGRKGGSVKPGKDSENPEAIAKQLGVDTRAFSEPEPEPYKIEGSEDKSSGLGPPLDLDREAWEKGVGLLVASGANSKSARSMFGKLVKSAGSARALLPAIVQAQVNGTADPASYLARAASRISGTDRKSPRSDSDEVARIMAEPIF